MVVGLKSITMQEIQIDGRTFKVECVHCGQHHPYGDTHREYNILCEDSTEDEIQELMRVFFNYNVPLKKDWNHHDCMSYFNGYCEITKIDGGFKYDKVEPYDD